MRHISISTAITEAHDTAEELRDELQDWLDNIPENMQGGQKASELEEAIGHLEEAMDHLDQAENAFEDFKIGEVPVVCGEPKRRKRMSRADRLAAGRLALDAIPDEAEAPEGIDPEEWNTAWDDVRSSLDSAIMELDEVSFPGMR